MSRDGCLESVNGEPTLLVVRVKTHGRQRADAASRPRMEVSSHLEGVFSERERNLVGVVSTPRQVPQ